MTIYRIPREPFSGEVWDDDGIRFYRADRGRHAGFWVDPVNPDLPMTWTELLDELGPLTDVPPAAEEQP